MWGWQLFLLDDFCFEMFAKKYLHKNANELFSSGKSYCLKGDKLVIVLIANKNVFYNQKTFHRAIVL